MGSGICDACLRQYTGPKENRTLLDLDGVACPHYTAQEPLLSSAGTLEPEEWAQMKQQQQELCGCISPAVPSGKRFICGLPDGHDEDCYCDLDGVGVSWPRSPRHLVESHRSQLHSVQKQGAANSTSVEARVQFKHALHHQSTGVTRR